MGIGSLHLDQQAGVEATQMVENNDLPTWTSKSLRI